jgi:2-methylcitrate dehydratase PrpD
MEQIQVQELSSPIVGPVYDKEIAAVAHYVHHYSIADSGTFQKSRTALLDALGCAIETVSKSSEARRFIGPVVPGSSVPHGFRLPGTSHMVDPVKGAFDMSVLIRYLDHNDALGGAAWGHPSGTMYCYFHGKSITLKWSRQLRCHHICNGLDFSIL